MGGQMQGGPTNQGGGNRSGSPNGGNYGGAWFGDYPPNGLRTIPPQEFQNNYTQTLQTLRQLEQQVQASDPAMVKDLQNLIRDMQRLNPNTYANDPLLAERIPAARALEPAS